MKKFKAIFTALYLLTNLTDNFSAVAQDSGYFSKDLQFGAKIKPFCKNSANKDFAPFAWNKIVFITSSRLTNKNKHNINPITRKPFLNVYGYDPEGNPVELNFLPPTVNKNLNCGPIAIARDTSLLVITKNYSKPNKDGVQNLYLAYYLREKEKWSREKLFPYNNSDFSFQHPYIDDQTNTLYFSSNMPGGFGKFDLYKCLWDGNNWSSPVNLGPDINSPYNEAFPSLSPDGALVYTSDHPGTLGGLDLVYYKNNNRYLLPEPFNTFHDDLSLTFTDKSSGYFSSNRDQATHEDNIFFFELVSSYVIRVLDRETKMPVPDVLVTFKAKHPLLDDRIKTSAIGEGLIHQGPEDPFPVSFELQKEGYQPLNVVSKNFLQEDDYQVLTLSLEPIPKVSTTLATISDAEGNNVPMDYYIIVGSYRILNNANRSAEKLRSDFHQKITILSQTLEGYHRLCNGKYSTHEEALSAMEDFTINNNADAWILSVKR
jgi:hypothetical protein